MFRHVVSTDRGDKSRSVSWSRYYKQNPNRTILKYGGGWRGDDSVMLLTAEMKSRTKSLTVQIAVDQGPGYAGFQEHADLEKEK